MPEGQKDEVVETFLTSATRTWMRVAMASTLIVAFALILLSATWVTGYYLVPGSLERLSRLPLKIVSDPLTFIFTKQDLEFSSFNVPAFLLTSQSRLTLKANTVYTIVANGAVVTANSSAQPPPAVESIAKEINREYPELGKTELLESANRISWRDPTGEYIYFDSESQANSADDCVQDKSESLKLLPKIRYGALLALVVPRHESPRFIQNKTATESYAVLSNYAVLYIGLGGTLTYDSKSARINFSDQTRTVDIDVPFLKDAAAEVMFVINDTVITRPEDFTFEDPKCAKSADLGFRKFSSKLYEQLKDQKKPAIWYLDNDGSFTVNVIAKIS